MRIDKRGSWQQVGDGWALVGPSDYSVALGQGVVQNDGSVLIDNGNGNGVEIHYDADGVETHRVERDDLPVAEPDPQADAVVKATALAVTLLEDPEAFANLVAAVASSNTAKDPLVFISGAFTTAAQATTPDLPPTA